MQAQRVLLPAATRPQPSAGGGRPGQRAPVLPRGASRSCVLDRQPVPAARDMYSCRSLAPLASSGHLGSCTHRQPPSLCRTWASSTSRARPPPTALPSSHSSARRLRSATRCGGAAIAWGALSAAAEPDRMKDPQALSRDARTWDSLCMDRRPTPLTCCLLSGRLPPGVSLPGARLGAAAD